MSNTAGTPDSDVTPKAPVTPDSPNWMRPFGKTGLMVSAVTMGGGPLGHMPQLFGYDVPEEQAITLVADVCATPIRSIDTGNAYGEGRSEVRIAAGLKRAGAAADGMLVATKVDAKDGDYSGARVFESIKESQARLGMEYLPLVYLHDPEIRPRRGFRTSRRSDRGASRAEEPGRYRACRNRCRSRPYYRSAP